MDEKLTHFIANLDYTSTRIPLLLMSRLALGRAWHLARPTSYTYYLLPTNYLVILLKKLFLTSNNIEKNGS